MSDPLSIADAAASLLTDAPSDDDQHAPLSPEAAEALEVSDEELAGIEAVDPIDGEEQSDGEQEGAEEQQEDIPPPPNSWSKDDAKAWDELTPAARDVVLRREGERDKFIADAGRRSAEARKAVEREAMEAVAARADEYAAKLDAVARQYLPQPPDINLLASNDPDAVVYYQRQKALYDHAIAQHYSVQQEVDQARAQANAARDTAQRSLLADEAQRLAEQLPEWNDPTSGPKLRNELQSIGAELGYPAELMADAGATDILALKKAAEWKAKAAKFDKLMAKRMDTVRSAKTMPRMTRPGAVTTRTPQQSAQDMDARIQSFNETRSPEAAAALLLQRTR